MRKSLATIIIALLLAATLSACGESSYSLHNSDGSLNHKYVSDMNNYFAKHPEKNPYGW